MDKIELIRVISKYDLIVDNIIRLSVGSGGDTYLFESQNKKYVLKMTNPDIMNHPEKEVEVCLKLSKYGINTINYVKNINGTYSFKYKNFVCNVYEYIEGNTFKLHDMEENYVNECATILGKIHLALNDLKLEIGIGKDFFKNMTVERARASYLGSKEKALKVNNQEIIDYLDLRINLLDKVKDFNFDLSQLTYKNSHGDYTNNQIVLSEVSNQLFIIDLTCACYQIVVWELVRFFFHSDKTAYLKFSKERFNEYLTHYIKYVPLTDYEINNCVKLYFYQILVCDYYSQYFMEKDKLKKKDYLKQANFSSEILKNNYSLLYT